MKLKGNLILCAPLRPPEKTAGGIVRPLDPKYFDDEKQWRVLEVGPGKTVVNKRTKVKTLVPMEVAPGDRVLVDQTLGNKFAFDDGRRIFDADQVLLKW